MKILLTSAGISSSHMVDCLNNLSKDTNRKIGFISTAGNVESGNKDWFINQFINLWRYGFNWIDIIDISAPGINWKERLSEVDIVFISGGNTFHLLDQVYKTGFDLWIKEVLDKKIFVGISAGSIIMTPKINIASVDGGDENKCGLQNLTGLGLVDFEFCPHSPEVISYSGNEEYAKSTKNKVVCSNDVGAIAVFDGKVEFIKGGVYKEF